MNFSVFPVRSVHVPLRPVLPAALLALAAALAAAPVHAQQAAEQPGAAAHRAETGAPAAAQEPAASTEQMQGLPATPHPTGVAPRRGAGGAVEEPPARLPDLSPWGMFRNADALVKAVLIGLALASLGTWTIWLAKGVELRGARRRLGREIARLKGMRTLDQAAKLEYQPNSLSQALIAEAQEELQLSQGSAAPDGIQARIAFRLERRVAASGRQMSQGTGVLASIGSTAPFIGLFGTVWGIMNSFIGIARAQTSNLAVVAPGIAEALLATACGLLAAIPAVLAYNVFARSIAAYKAQLGDASAQVLLLVSRDLDRSAADRTQASARVKVS